MVLGPDGNYTYTVDESNASVQALRLSTSTLTDVFSYTISDAAGLTSTTQLTITIQGSNDTPMAVSDSATAVEAGGLSNGTAGTNPTGNLLTNDTDVDSGDTKAVSGIVAGTVSSATGNVGAAVAGTYGSITVAADGSYTYSVDNSNATVQGLRTSSNTIQDVFTYTMVDASGATSTTQITVTIQGANDTPTAVSDSTAVAVEAGGTNNASAGSNGTGNVLTNDTDVDANGNGETKTVSGVAAGNQASATGNVGSSVAGTYGSMTVNSDGTYTYVVNENNSAVQALRTSSQTLTDVFTYTMVDNAGLSSTTQVSVTIQGANDAPVGVNDTGTASEAGGVNNATAGSNGTGNVLTNDTDVDSGDSKSVNGVVAGASATASGLVGTSVSGTYGAITINSDGSYTYVISNNNSAVQALRTVSDTLSEVFTYSVVDAGGLSSLATITMTITGRNDAPVSNDDSAIAIEAGGISNGTAGSNGTGSVLANDTDVDSGDTKTVIGVLAGGQASASGNVGGSLAGTYGSINLAADGTYTYTVDESNATVQALRTTAQTLTEIFTYTMADTAGLTSTATVTITIQGQNDAPSAVDDNGDATEAGGVANGTAGSNATGNVLTNDSDVDSSGNSETKAVLGVAAGAVGTTTNNAGSAVVGTYGSVTVNADGSYTYVIDNANSAVQALRVTGQTLADVFTYRMADAIGLESLATLTVTIHGANDNPVGVSDTANAVEAGGYANGTAGTNPTGNVLTNDTDVDSVGNGETKAVSGVVAGASSSAVGSVGSAVVGGYGSITINADGSYTYNVNNSNAAVQALRTPSDSLTDLFTYSIVDAGGLSGLATITVTITGQSDAPTDLSAAPLAINENTANGTAIGTVTPTDIDASDTFTYQLTNNAGGRFTIHSTTGEITVADGTLLDRENIGSHLVTVQVTDALGLTFSKDFTISVNDVDEFNTSAISDANGAANSVVENATNGSVVGITAFASDADATTNAITYTLDDNAGGRFAIHATTGVVTVLDGSLLDYEALASHNITVRATSQDASFSTTTYTIQLVDANEGAVGAVSDNNATLNFVNENATNGTLVGITGRATDPDGTDVVTYSLDNDAGGRFAIDSNSGIVTVVGVVDREAAPSYDIVIRATSTDSSFSVQTFTISIGDIDEFNVGAVTDGNVAGNTVAENASVGTVVGLTAQAADGDATTNAISYSLFDNDGGRFAIDANTGVVSVLGAIDREADGTSRTITVRATSADGSFTDQNFTITITDVDEFNATTPVDTDVAANAIDENAAIGTAVGITANSADADSTTNAITYSLFDSDGGNFAIDTITGVVTSANLLDRETLGATRNITVRATSADGSTADTVFTIAINDLDEFDTSAVSDSNAAANSVAENASNGTAVGITAAATDNDATTNAITYTLDDNAGGRFAIHATTGVVTVLDGSLLDFESVSSHNITVRATSQDGSTTTRTFAIQLTDVNEGAVGSVADTDATADFVDENATIGTIVGVTGRATDPDGTDLVTYSLDNSAGGRFAIDANTGIVTVAGAIDREAAPSYNITVRATSTDGSFSTQGFTIQIGDLDEFNVGSVSDSDGAANAVAENASAGTVIGITAQAFDGDATNSAVTYSLFDNDGGRFAIDSNTGVVTVAGSIDRELDGPTRNITVRATSVDGSHTDQVFSISVTDVDEFNVTAPSDSDATVNAVNENVSIGTVVGITAASHDADSTNNAVTYSLFDSDGGNFAIDSNTGVVTTAQLLDREALGPVRSITIRASSSDESTADTVFSIAINDLDEFDASVTSDANASVNNVAENAASGTTVGVSGFAMDQDATNNVVTYSLDDSAGGRFAIDANSGIVTVQDGSLLDYESQTSHNITVRSTSQDGSFTTATFTIQLTDVNESAVGSISDLDGSADVVTENSTIGTSVGISATAIDPDGTAVVTYSLDDDAGGRFAIDANSGVVTVAGAIDREAAASYNIAIRATSSDTSYSQRTYSISINDVDEFNVGTVTDSDPGANHVAENAANGATVGIAASGTDADATTNAITYSLVNNDGGRFAIDANSGVVTVAGAIDRETDGAIRSITVRATSVDGSFTDQAFSINIDDVDEYDVSAPTDVDATMDAVDENAANGTVVGITTVASDTDASTNAVSYSLTDSAGGRFAIDSNTGVVTVANGSLLDRESAASHDITVRATSADGSTADTTFTIQLNDVDDFDVVASGDANVSVNQVQENAGVGTTVGLTALAIDQDVSNNTITYSMINNDGGRFSVDVNTGVVQVAGAIDREMDGPIRTVTVRATSVDGSIVDQVFTINIIDVDEFDVTLPVDTDGTVDIVLENSAIGTLVGVVASATDGDATDNTITYSLDDSSGGRFAIDSATGIVRTAAMLDYELFSSHRITVRATSADGSTTTADFFIAVQDGNEMPIGRGESYTTSYAETITTTAPGLLANDSDPEGSPLSIVLVNGPSTGTLTINADGSFTYRPTIPFIGQVFIDYYVTDGVLQSALTTAVVNVTQAVAPPPADNGGGGSNTGGSTTDNSGGSTSSTSNNTTENSSSTTSDSSNNTDNNAGGATNSGVVGPLMDNASVRGSSNEAGQAANSGSQSSEAATAASAAGVGLIDIHYAGITQANIESLLAWGNSSSSSHSAVGRLMAEAEAREIVGLAKMIHTFVNNENASQLDTGLTAGTSVEIATKTAIGSGMVIWIARIGQFAAAVLAASSAWRHIDPLSILNATKGADNFDEADKLFENSKSSGR